LVLRGTTSGRTDDTSEIIRQRLEVYTKQTEPLIAFYEKLNMVKTIDGMGEINDITERILKTVS
jgi:adenylate kinase